MTTTTNNDPDDDDGSTRAADTLVDFPHEARDLEHLHFVFDRLAQYSRGVLLTGKASAFVAGHDWGPALPLPDGGLLYLRATPVGTLGPIARGEQLRHAIYVASRVVASSGEQTTTVVVILPSVHTLPTARAQHNLWAGMEAPVGPRGMFIPEILFFGRPLAPTSYPTTHDDVRRSALRPRWPTSELLSHFDGVRATSFIFSDSQSNYRETTCPGTSIFTVAGLLCDDTTTTTTNDASFEGRRCMVRTRTDWQQQCRRVHRALIMSTTPSRAVDAVCAAHSILDLLSCEGITEMLAHEELSPVLPEGFTRVSGIPLVVACAVRLACNPTLNGFTVGTACDQAAARDLKVLFEQSHPPLECGMGQAMHLMAIDIVLRAATREVYAEAPAVGDGEMCNGTLWALDAIHMLHRMGTRCVRQLFGIAPCDKKTMLRDGNSNPYHKSGGMWPCDDAQRHGELWEARREAIRESGRVPDDDTPFREDTSVSGLHLVHHLTAQRMLLRMLNSVERWLRTGSCDTDSGRGCTRTTATPSSSSDGTAGEGEGTGGVTSHDAMWSNVARNMLCSEACEEALRTVQHRMLSPGANMTDTLNVACYLVHPEAKHSCADCDKSRVHVTACVLTAHAGTWCTHCGRGRCLSCAKAAAREATEGRPRVGCRHCRPSRRGKKKT